MVVEAAESLGMQVCMKSTSREAGCVKGSRSITLWAYVEVFGAS